MRPSAITPATVSAAASIRARAFRSSSTATGFVQTERSWSSVRRPGERCKAVIDIGEPGYAIARLRTRRLCQKRPYAAPRRPVRALVAANGPERFSASQRALHRRGQPLAAALIIRPGILLLGDALGHGGAGERGGWDVRRDLVRGE